MFHSLSNILQRHQLLALPGTCSQGGDSAGEHTDFDECWEGKKFIEWLLHTTYQRVSCWPLGPCGLGNWVTAFVTAGLGAFIITDNNLHSRGSQFIASS